MAFPLDLFGQKFHKLTVIKRAPKRIHTMWLCRCDCGNMTIAETAKIRSGHTKSCGCLKFESKNKTHGLSRSAEYNCWCSMNTRVSNPSEADYANYLGRGITICNRWRKFENFYDDMGERPSNKHSIDRIDNDKNYSPDNCKWSTKREQGRNRRTNNHITIDGVTKLLIDWVELSPLCRSTYYKRKKLGFSDRNALGL